MDIELNASQEANMSASEKSDTILVKIGHLEVLKVIMSLNCCSELLIASMLCEF